MRKVTVVIFLSFLAIPTNAQWVVQQVPTTNTLYDIYFVDSAQGWVTGHDGIFHTLDGGSNWEIQYTGHSGQLSGLNTTDLWVTRFRDTLLHSTNGGISWDIVTINEFTDFDSTYYIATVYFYDIDIGWIQAGGWISGGVQYRLLKTTDRGLSWEMNTDPWLSWNAHIQFLDSLNGFRTGSGIPFFRTTDGGSTWDLVTWYGYMETFSMKFLTKEIGWMSIDGPVLTTSVIKTTNGGENWIWNITFQCSDLSTYLSFVDTLRGWVVQATCISGGTEILHTLDGGSSWELQFIYSPSFYFRPRQIFFVDSLHGWVVGDNGIVLHTSTGGIIPVELISFTAEVVGDRVTLNWTTATETNNQGFGIEKQIGSKQSAVGKWDSIGFVTGNGTTTEPRSYSFTDENVTTGIYKYRLKQIDYDGTFSYSDVVDVELNLVPEEFKLYQNYPNPFNPTTVISYQLPVISNVTLKVYDILGNDVATLVNEEKSAGEYEITFDAEKLSSGTYIVVLRTKEQQYTQKIIYLK